MLPPRLSASAAKAEKAAAAVTRERRRCRGRRCSARCGCRLPMLSTMRRAREGQRRSQGCRAEMEAKLAATSQESGQGRAALAAGRLPATSRKRRRKAPWAHRSVIPFGPAAPFQRPSQAIWTWAIEDDRVINRQSGDRFCALRTREATEKRDMHQFTSRICGICAGATAVASCARELTLDIECPAACSISAPFCTSFRALPHLLWLGLPRCLLVFEARCSIVRGRCEQTLSIFEKAPNA